MSKKILVTGGAGYLGSVLVPTLLGAGHDVTVVDNFMWRQSSLLDCCAYDRFRLIRGDCRDPGLMKDALRDADVIIPLAALVGAPLCARDTMGATSINLDAIKLILSLRSPAQAVLYPTTNSGYGIGEHGKFCTEDSPLRPISLYGTTKCDAERALLDAKNVVTFRLATVFGLSPRMRLDLLVNDFTYRAVTDRAVVIFEGHFKRNYIHIRDVARVFLHGLDHFDAMRDRPYNVGLDDANLSKIELCEVIKQHVKNFVYLEAPIGEDPDKRDYIVSNARLAATGFVPEWSLDRGVRELVKGYSIIRNAMYSNFA
jgi:nucleoside-diphosphate-sugar epimerase